jgi:hypothetical protein
MVHPIFNWTSSLVTESHITRVFFTSAMFAYLFLLLPTSESQVTAVGELATLNYSFALVGHVQDFALEVKTKLGSGVGNQGEDGNCVGHTYYISRIDQDLNAFLCLFFREV